EPLQEVPDSLSGLADLVEETHASRHVQEKSDRDALLLVHVEEIDLLRNMVLEDLEVLLGQAEDGTTVPVAGHRRQQDAIHADGRREARLEHPADLLFGWERV